MTRSTGSRASSARSRALALLAALALALVECSTGQDGDGPRTGAALATDGTQSSGVVGNHHVRVGEVWYFALPVPRNVSSRPIDITDVGVERVPQGVELLGYGAYHLDDTEGLPLLAKEGEPHAPDFDNLKNYAHEPLRVAARSSSDVFYLVKVRITAPPDESLRWCRFDYRQGGSTYTQELDCEADLRVAAQDRVLSTR
ncbi:hypothetical protein JNUCC64_13955 [Streptomyces sp. JNUCC 64]